MQIKTQAAIQWCSDLITDSVEMLPECSEALVTELREQ